MLTTELESYRRIITPAILKAAGVHLRLQGIYEPPRIKWDIINLQDEVESAKAKLLLAQAGSLKTE